MEKVEACWNHFKLNTLNNFILGKKNLKFAKIYTSLEVLQRYAEILKIRMPIKKFSAEMLHSESAEGDDMLEFKLTQLSVGGDCEVGASTVRIPLFSDVHDGFISWMEKIQEPLFPSEVLFPRANLQYTAVYSRLEYQKLWLIKKLILLFYKMSFLLGIKTIYLITRTQIYFHLPQDQELLNFC